MDPDGWMRARVDAMMTLESVVSSLSIIILFNHDMLDYLCYRTQLGDGAEASVPGYFWHLACVRHWLARQ
eukprot:SAG31_NODE_1_length_62978_cov_30.836130_16_plen_70_part_00